jgi:hypothetical protein
MAGTFELYRDNAGEYRFRLKSSNGQIVLGSEGYKSKDGARNGIASVQKNCTDPARFALTESDGGKFRFALRAKNNQVIGTSQSYDSAAARDNGVEAVSRAAQGASITEAGA